MLILEKRKEVWSVAVAKLKKVKAKPEWYLKLVEDLKEIIAGGEHDFIRFKHKLGARILEEKERIPYGDIAAFFEDLAKDVGYSVRELYYCVQFAETYPDVEAFLEKFRHMWQKLTWRYVRNVLLPGKIPEHEKLLKMVKCECCGSEFPSEEIKTLKLCAICSAEYLTFMAMRGAESEGA